MVEVQVDFEYYGNVVAKCSFANVVMRMVGIGIQLVICIYSLVVFLETPNSERKGRGPYIVMSFVILVISAIPVALDSSLLFRQLREATSGRRFITILGQDISSWEVTVSTSLLPAYILVADGLLISSMASDITGPETSGESGVQELE
ncbi:hypothetical protein CC2G_014811 [Coprinopsis cinerea AmutBmut pab1-1]|nr:hypothetical protein CC2G_014811 [Coprinopsis cinerea AmutBmut pab1-1]